MAQDRVRRAGTSRIGAPGRVAQGVLHVFGPTNVTGTGLANKPGILALDAVSDAGVVTTYYLWVDDTGDLRIGSTFPTNQDGDGAVVGSQS